MNNPQTTADKVILQAKISGKRATASDILVVEDLCESHPNLLIIHEESDGSVYVFDDKSKLRVTHDKIELVEDWTR